MELGGGVSQATLTASNTTNSLLGCLVRSLSLYSHFVTWFLLTQWVSLNHLIAGSRRCPFQSRVSPLNRNCAGIRSEGFLGKCPKCPFYGATSNVQLLSN